MTDVRSLPIDRWLDALKQGSFEEVQAALEQVVQRLEEGQLPLADSVDCFELGMRLAERCQRFLDEAELRVSQLEVVHGDSDDVNGARDGDESL